MDEQRPVVSATLRAHRRQLAWQILVPVLVVAALIIAAAVLIASQTGSVSRTWADVSTIWLIAPMLVFALLFVTLLGFLIYGLARLLRITPPYIGKVQDFFSLLAVWTRKGADGAARPVVWSRQAGAIFRSIFKL
jgi:hypothetical protein